MKNMYRLIREEMKKVVGGVDPKQEYPEVTRMMYCKISGFKGLMCFSDPLAAEGKGCHY